MELIEIILICLIVYCICTKCLKTKESYDEFDTTNILNRAELIYSGAKMEKTIKRTERINYKTKR